MSKTIARSPHLVRRIKLLKRYQYRLDAYLRRRNKVKFNETAIPHRVDRFLKTFSHKNFTGLYFKNVPHYYHFREVLFCTVLEAGPAKAVDFIHTLGEQSKSKVEFYRQIKYEFTYFLNQRVLKSKGDYVEHFANNFLGEKCSKLDAEFITNEILSSSEKKLFELESSKDLSVETEKLLPNSTVNQQLFSWKGNKKDFLMFCLIPLLSENLQQKPGFTKKLYLERLGEFFGIEIPENHDANIKSAIEQGSYHEMINDLISFIREYEKKFLEDQKVRNRDKKNKKDKMDSVSGINYQQNRL